MNLQFLEVASTFFVFLFHGGNKPAYSILQWVDDDKILIYS